ncbi:MAG: beta-ketoacyl-[acyl-carrier-protein] synthase family protein [Pirellulaceae bacterium]|nr:beta-ketoacyl-[acyl-carrier-protein] synthase family protein [Pirellulaceae bacterium]
MSRRVVITGCGVVSPLGNTKETLWQALCAGESGVRPLTQFSTATLPMGYGGEVRDFAGKIDDFGPLAPAQKKTIRKGLKVMCREIKMGVAAAQLALTDAGLGADSCDPERTGVIYGSDYIMTDPEEFEAGIRNCLTENGKFEISQWPESGIPQVTPLWLLKYLPNMPACHVAIYNDLRGPNNSITVREASSNLAIAEAYSTIQRGHADMILTGATGSRIHPLRTVHTALQEDLACGDDDPAKVSRPFDLNRKGMVIGEGAGTMVLEELDHAVQREANILGEVVGYGSSTVMDQNAIGNQRQALENVMRQALRTSSLAPQDIGHVHAHGLSTRDCDRAEAVAIEKVFSERAEPVPVAAAKSYFGNLGAAGGMIELISSLMAIRDGKLFKTLNYETPDPECALNLANGREGSAGDSVLNVNVTPQGQASSIVIRRYSA